MSTVQPDQIDIQIGIYEGCEWDYTEIAQHVGRTTEALRVRRSGPKKTFIDQISAFVQFGLERKLKPRIAAADMKRRISEKAWRNLEVLLERTEKDANGEEKPVRDALLLAAVKEALDRTEGKPLDRKAILSAHQENIDITVRQVDGDALDDIAAEAQRINEIRRKALAPASNLPPLQVTEAQLLEPAN